METAIVKLAETTETFKKAGWWSSRSNVTKGLIITGAIVIIAGGAYLLLRDKKDDSTKVNNSNDEDNNNSVEDNEKSESNTELSSTDKNELENEQQAEENKSSVDSTQEQQGIVYDASTLPNGGVDCATPRLNYDGNYDYVKCKGIWYVKSKQKSKTPSVNVPNWAGLKPESLRASRLESRYPNG